MAPADAPARPAQHCQCAPIDRQPYGTTPDRDAAPRYSRKNRSTPRCLGPHGRQLACRSQPYRLETTRTAATRRRPGQHRTPSSPAHGPAPQDGPIAPDQVKMTHNPPDATDQHRAHHPAAMPDRPVPRPDDRANNPDRGPEPHSLQATSDARPHNPRTATATERDQTCLASGPSDRARPTQTTKPPANCRHRRRDGPLKSKNKCPCQA